MSCFQHSCVVACDDCIGAPHSVSSGDVDFQRYKRIRRDGVGVGLFDCG